MTATASFAADYGAATEDCALHDRSERGKLALTGSGAKEFLQGQVTNDVVSLAAGEGLYAAFLTAKGKMLGDLRVLDTGEELLLDTERTALQELFNMIRRYSLGYQVQLHKRTLESALLSLLGPNCEAVLAAVTGAPVALGPAEHDHVATRIAGTDVRLIRAPTGVDLLFASEAFDAVRGSLVDGGAKEIGDDVAECLRVELGRPRYGVDLDETVIPQEAGLNERAVSFTKGCYVGQETVARLYYKGKPNRSLQGLEALQPLTPGTVLSLGDREVATVTSAVQSPVFGSIGLALVRREAPVDSVVEAKDGTAVRVVELPFGTTSTTPPRDS